MNDWASFMLTLDEHRKSVDKLLTNYPPVQTIDERTAMEVEAHLDAIVGCCNQVDAWVANNSEGR